MATHTCNQNCGCKDTYTVVAPCPPACPEVFNAQCIVYTGTDILCNQDVVIKRYDYLDTIITKLVNYICNVQAPITQVLGSTYIDVVPSTVGNVTTYTVSVDIPALQAYFDAVFQADLFASILAGPGIAVAQNNLTGTVTISHADTSAVGPLSSDNSGNSFIQDIFFTFDTYGHVTGASVVPGTVIPPDDFNKATVNPDTGFTWGPDNDPTNIQIAEAPGDTLNFVAGVGIALNGSTVPGTDAIRIRNTAPDQIVTIAEGAGIDVTGTYPNFTVANTDPGSAVSLANAGGTESLVNDGTGPALATKGLTAGTGIALTGTANDVTIANTDPGSAVTLADSGTGTHVNLVDDGTGPALAVLGLAEGTNIKLTVVDGNVVISSICCVNKFEESIVIPDNPASIVVTHNLNTLNVVLSLSTDGLPPYDHIQDDAIQYKYQIVDANNVEIFGITYSGPARVTILG